MLVHVKKVLAKAKKECKCVGAFNIHNIESVKGVAQAASLTKAPCIIQVSPGSVKYLGLKSIVGIVEEMTEQYAPKELFALHLDHGKDVGMVYDCIQHGFTSVHIDASEYELKKNIQITRRVVNYAHKKGVWVQGEIGVIKGGHGLVGDRIGEVPLANLEDVIKFVSATGIDTVACAVGTAHGSFCDENISFELLETIKSSIKQPFVLHGGSGVENRQIKKAIRMGVNIINVGTDVKVAFCESVIKASVDNKKETDPRVLLGSAVDAVRKVVVKKMMLFS